MAFSTYETRQRADKVIRSKWTRLNTVGQTRHATSKQTWLRGPKSPRAGKDRPRPAWLCPCRVVDLRFTRCHVPSLIRYDYPVASSARLSALTFCPTDPPYRLSNLEQPTGTCTSRTLPWIAVCVTSPKHPCSRPKDTSPTECSTTSGVCSCLRAYEYFRLPSATPRRCMKHESRILSPASLPGG